MVGCRLRQAPSRGRSIEGNDAIDVDYLVMTATYAEYAAWDEQRRARFPSARHWIYQSRIGAQAELVAEKKHPQPENVSPKWTIIWS